MIINLTDKYETHDGIPVTILHTNLRGDLPILAILHLPYHDTVDTYKADGTSWLGSSKLVNVSPYKSWKEGDAILCARESMQIWHRRYFQGVNEDGEVLTYPDGGTKWSTEGLSPEVWYTAMKPEDV